MGFWNSDPIQNPDQLQPNIFLTIWNPDIVWISDPRCILCWVFILDKLAYAQVITNSLYFAAQLRTREEYVSAETAR